ncbi:hypothetical protein ACSMXN_00885 [Jatrophihabitans sp. DSM 45814]
MRKVLPALVLAAASAAMIAAASSASAHVVIVNGGHDFTYQGCEAHAEAMDLNAGSKPGFAQYVITKGYNAKMPGGCDWDIYTKYDYWDGHAVRHGQAHYVSVQQSKTPVFSVFGNVRVTGMTVELCRTVGTTYSCKSFVGTVTT